MSEDNDRLIANFNSASSAVKKSMGGKAGEAAEKVYAIAYQQLVKAGIKPQLRKKYR